MILENNMIGCLLWRPMVYERSVTYNSMWPFRRWLPRFAFGMYREFIIFVSSKRTICRSKWKGLAVTHCNLSLVPSDLLQPLVTIISHVLQNRKTWWCYATQISELTVYEALGDAFDSLDLKGEVGILSALNLTCLVEMLTLRGITCVFDHWTSRSKASTLSQALLDILQL